MVLVKSLYMMLASTIGLSLARWMGLSYLCSRMILLYFQ